MNYAAIKTHDIANGEGVRVSLFVSGCLHHCKGCFNPETWDYGYGLKYTSNTESCILEMLNKEYISGLSILGGEPLSPSNVKEVATLCMSVKQTTGKTVWVYTGYTWEELMERVSQHTHFTYDDGVRLNILLRQIDILVDGRYIEEERDITLKWRGSRNQRVIDVQKSLAQGKVVLWCE